MINNYPPVPKILMTHKVLTYVDVSAASIGISSSFSFYFVAIANAGSLLGRYVAGYMSDRLGKTKLFVPSSYWALIFNQVQ